MEQAVACAPVMQRTRVRYPVGVSFLDEVFFGVFPHLHDKCREALDPQVPRISFGLHNHPFIFNCWNDWVGNGVYCLSCSCCLGGGSGIELIPHPERPPCPCVVKKYECDP